MRKFFGAAMIALVTGCAVTSADNDTMRAGPETVRLENEGWALIGNWRAAETDGPAVLLLHRAAGNRSEYDELADALAARGVASLALDLRGHGESVNLGRFEPPYAENLYINEGAYRDVIVALDWVAAQERIDASRLAVAAGSYSGEAAALALREGAIPVAAAVMLSPGNFSDESIAMAQAQVEAAQARWLFVRSEEEGPASKPHIDALFEALDTLGPSLEQRKVDGAGHASGLFEGRPALVEEIADWIADALAERDNRD